MLAEDKGVRGDPESEESPYGKALRRGIQINAYKAVHRGKTAKTVMSPVLIRNAWTVDASAMSVKDLRAKSSNRGCVPGEISFCA